MKKEFCLHLEMKFLQCFRPQNAVSYICYLIDAMSSIVLDWIRAIIVLKTIFASSVLYVMIK